ncbi:MAG: DUF2141 domain-containing protein [Gammaproteobacteria bacterium]|nr:DUF2141 domain-containing protein [Gammaproteobacteria bacterium]
MTRTKRILSLLSLLAVSAHVFAANTGNLTVTFTNISNDKGVIRVALFNSEQTYKNSGDKGVGTFATASPTITNNVATATFKALPFGTYAIKSFHDQNLSAVIPRNFFGVPQTDYGFSENPVIHTGPPSFDEAKFAIQSANTAITIKMLH